MFNQIGFNKSQCKHNAKVRKEGLCKECQDTKPYTVFRYCEVKTCNKGESCQHAGYFYHNGEKKPEYPIATTKLTTKPEHKEATKLSIVDELKLFHHYEAANKLKHQQDISVYLIKLLTILGRNNLAHPRMGTTDPNVRSDLIYEGWELLKCLK
jgi:hypothetical protein